MLKLHTHSHIQKQKETIIIKKNY